MEFGGRYRVSAPRQRVWVALNDTAVLQAAIPGCQRIDWTGPTTLELEIKLNLGFLHPVLTGDLSLLDIRAAERYTLQGQGRGGVLGLAQGAADIRLSDLDDADTELLFVASGAADGGIMKLGKSLLGNSAQKVIDGFFVRFGTAMGATVVPLRHQPSTGPS